MELDEALPIIARLSRTKNYPRDEDGLTFLAEGLIRAAAETGANAQQIVMVCATTSEWCPTDADLMNIARQIRDEQKRAQEALEPSVESQWRQKYGPPKPFDWKALDTEKIKLTKAREKKLYAAIKANHPEELTWAGMIAAARELGYDDYADAWSRGMK
jgi:hypothetical protein